MDETAIMVHVPIIADDYPPSVLEPGIQAFDLPAPPEATQRASVLGGCFATSRPMRSNQLNALRSQAFVERITVIRFVANQPLGESRCETTLKRPVNKGDFIRRSTR